MLLVLLGFISAAHEYETDPTKKPGSAPLFRIERDGKLGFMDRTGRIVIPPQFNWAGDFFEGLAWFQLDERGKRGFIDDRGKIKIAPQFDDTLDFHEGFAPVRIGRRWGYMDRSGKMAIPPQFQQASEFSEGRARVTQWDQTTCSKKVFTKENAPDVAFQQSFMPDCSPITPRFAFIDHNGKRVIEGTFRYAASFSEGLAIVSRTGSQKCEFMDASGKTAIAAKFDNCQSFSEGLAAVGTGFNIKGNQRVAGKYGFIDKAGKFVIEPKFAFARPFREGFAAVELTPNWWAYVDHAGRFVSADRFRSAESFSDGLAAVCKHNGECFYIDRRGQRLPGISGFGRRFTDGLAILGGNYVDRHGRVVARR